MGKTDCVESVLKRWYISYSRQVLCRFPVTIALAALLVCAVLGVGMIFFSYKTDTEVLFTPHTSQAKDDREIARKLFPVDYDRFLPDRVIEWNERQISVIITPSDGDDILTSDTLEDIFEFNSQVLSLKISVDGNEYTFKDLCSHWNGKCLDNPVLIYLENSFNDSVDGSVKLPYPQVFDENGIPYNIEQYLGDFKVENGWVTSAKSMLVAYFLRGGPNDELSGMWEDAVQDELDQGGFSSIEVFVFQSDGLDEAQSDITELVTPYFSITYTILITFAITSCLMFRDHVQSKSWLAFMGVVSASLSILCTLGLMSYCGVSFNQVATSVPFLILGIGLDDMFILISSWRDTDMKYAVEKRMEDTFGDVGVSITITTLTDFLAFLVGSISPLPAVKVFCLYAGVAVLIDLIYQVTFFGSFMIFFGRREKANRHTWTCLKVSPRGSDNSKFYNACCAGGISKKSKSKQIVHLGKIFFKEYFPKLFANTGLIFVIALFYFTYLGVSVYGCTMINNDFEQKNLAEQGSNTYTFLELQSDQYNEIGPSVSLMITEELPYWEQNDRAKLEEAMNSFQSNKFVKPKNYTQCWFTDFYEYLDRKQMISTDQETFLSILKDEFLKLPQFAPYNLDITFDENTITSSRCILVTQNVDTSTKEGEMMLALRDIATHSTAEVGAQFVVFSPDFVFSEQYVIIVPQTIQTLGIAAASMLLVSLLLIPNFIVAILVTLSVSSILTGVTGFMTFWGVSLDSISLINLVLCIGFSVDFTAHVTYGFVSSERNVSPQERIESTIGLLGYPILQSAFSTILGVSIMLIVPSYIFQTFAKIIILVMIIGLIHGLLFVPAVMIVFSSFVYKVDPQNGKQNRTIPHGNNNPAFNENPGAS